MINYINPVYWLSVLVTWIDKVGRKRQLIAAINEAEKINKETGKKMMVFNEKNGIALISKQDLKKKGLGHIKNKAFYTTK